MKNMNNEKDNGWISTENEYPSESGYYLCCNPYWDNPYEIVEYDENSGEFTDYHDEISHWQPLPELPKV